jgi:hypothetical protein
MPFRYVIPALILLTACGESTMGRFTTPATPTAQPVASQDMTGRWTFSAVSGASCAMNFTSQGAEGSIKPEGGCPGELYKSRQFIFDASGLVIRDHTAAPLAQLRSAGSNRFEGQAGAQAVSLSR